MLKDDGVLIAPTFTHAENSLRGRIKAYFMRLAGFPLHSRWTSEEYLSFLRQNGWSVRKSAEMCIRDSNRRILSATNELTAPLAYEINEIVVEMCIRDSLRAFKKCEDLSYPLPAGITNYGIALKVYGAVPGSGGRNENIEMCIRDSSTSELLRTL